MLTIPFLTDIDSRAEVKGSRDPLGVQAVWTRLGRHVVGNLTTVSTLLRDFTITMLGYHFAEQVADHAGAGTELATFLKWEQLAGYARAKVRSERSFRGRDRVIDRLNRGEKITLSEDRSGQILSNQKIYGLWGLYSSPARASGLLTASDPARLTEPAREVVERVYLRGFAEHGIRDKDLVALLGQERPRIDPHGAQLPLLKAVASVLGDKVLTGERELFRRHLVDGFDGARTEGLQPLLARLLLRSATDPSFTWSPSSVRRLESQAREDVAHGERLAFRLARIRASESLIAPMAMVFQYMLTLDGTTVAELVERLDRSWGRRLPGLVLDEVRALGDELKSIHQDIGARWLRIAECASTGEYTQLVQLLAEQNRQVMATRGGGAAWIDIQGSKLAVRFRDESGRIPQTDELPELWRFPYFMESLRRMVIAVEGGLGAN